jgi:Na+/melibiose symporter-like transporter
MSAILGSLFGLFGTGQLHTVLLLGMLTLAIFRPERVGSWTTFRASVGLFVLAVALPGLMMLLPGAEKGDVADQGLMRIILALSGILTALSIYFLLSSVARPASPQAP